MSLWIQSVSPSRGSTPVWIRQTNAARQSTEIPGATRAIRGRSEGALCKDICREDRMLLGFRIPVQIFANGLGLKPDHIHPEPLIVPNS